MEGIEMAGRVIPPWLTAMINAEFNTTQKHNANEKGYFCVDCGGESLSELQKEKQHEGHNVLKAYNTSRKYGYRDEDIYNLGSEVLDISGVRPFSINYGYVFFPKTRSKGLHLKNKGRLGYCFSCGYSIGSHHLFCSILCKLSCDKNDEELKKIALTMKQQNVGEALERKKSKQLKKKNRNGFKKIGGGLKMKKDSKCDFGKKLLGSIPDIGIPGFLSTNPDFEKNVGMEPGIQDLLAVVDRNIRENKLGFHKRRRKGIPHRAPLF